jgi:hypothetical protein
MESTAAILDAARTALRSVARLDPDARSIHVELDEGVLTMDGAVASVSAKKPALEAAAAAPGVSGIVDRFRVAPAQAMGDGQIRELVRDAVLQEPAFAEPALKERIKGEWRLVREPPLSQRGRIEIEVDAWYVFGVDGVGQ